ncbi:hypothetical protein PA598K_03530 [Paenibacillus sp. 598K]|uniref:hypothetical protein n=1 Tax=Paenibacillus sp. 598K TaxID=1117987 RepID=UPI000FF90F22|nr:hypothetical protein [Paenibacillus sp. 598K]GBF75145.1 hypothetical protein PA598K_03530 [Paenibacillus sp. 598K]
MCSPVNDTDARVRLEHVLELWYVWLSSHPAVLCGDPELARINEAARQLQETGDFMERSALAKAQWFLEKGAIGMLERIREGAYDRYE